MIEKLCSRNDRNNSNNIIRTQISDRPVYFTQLRNKSTLYSAYMYLAVVKI